MLLNSNVLESKKHAPISVDMSRVAALVLGGGAGSRLHPLTLSRCKPAICFGGRYRLIDVPISNSINSGCHKLFILTQFLSSSLHQHLFKTYRHDLFSSGFLELLAAEQKPDQTEWFQGTADAVRKNIDYFIDTPVDYFLILSGDQLYSMDFRNMLAFATRTDADLVVATLPIGTADAKRMGVMQIDRHKFITNFFEKPQETNLLHQLRSLQADHKPYLGSMGIYLFKRETLLNLLKEDPREDFGKHLIPTQVSKGNAAAYIHEGYWEDIGTIGSFYAANMDLTREVPQYNCYDEKWPLFSTKAHLSGPKIHQSYIVDSVLNEGVILEESKISGSILGPRTHVKKGTTIEESYVMGNDFYTPPSASGRLPEHLFIDENCVIRKTILDKHVHLGKGVRLINQDNLENYTGKDIYIRDGVIVVPQGVSLPDGFTL